MEELNLLNTIKKYTLAICIAICGIVITVFQPVFLIWNALKSGAVWFALFYQPMLVLITACILSKPIYAVCVNPNMVFIILIILGDLFLLLLENAIIELIYHLLGKSDNYDILQKLQKYFNNYVLLIVSLISLYFAAFSADSSDANLILLVIDALYLITTICSDAYCVFIYEKDSVKKLAKNIKAITHN